MAAGSYTLSFHAAQRANYQASQQDFEVLVDGNVVGTFIPLQHQLRPLHNQRLHPHRRAPITFQALDSAGGDNTAFVDDIQLSQATAATLSDAGFESPTVGTDSYGDFLYAPTGTPWTFSGDAGVAGNGSGFTSGNPNAPEGTQVGFLQETGSFSQVVAGWRAATR